MVPGLLILLASLAVEHPGFSSCGVWAQQLQLEGSRARPSGVVGHGLRCAVACVITHAGIEPVSPALAGGFLITGHPNPNIYR